MKILLTSVSLDLQRGAGTAERTRQLAIHLRAAGCPCCVIAMNGHSWDTQFAAAGIRAWTTGSIGRRFPVPLANPIRLWRLISDADIVHVLGYWNLLSAFVCILARLTGKPYVLCPAGEFANLDAPRRMLQWFHRLIGRRMIAQASSLIAITDLEKAEMAMRLGGGLPPIVVIPNGIALPPPPRQVTLPARMPQNRSFILFMGRLAAIKGPDLLLEAFGTLAQENQDIDLVLAGPDAGLESTLRQTASGLNLASRVHFLGFVDELQRVAIYRRAALLAVPSRSEAMSLVALEAAACGTMVLVTNRCGFDAIGENGGMVVPADASSIADALRTLLSRPKQLQQNGARLREFVLEQYGWGQPVAQLLSHFSALIGSSAAAKSEPAADASQPGSMH
jgi:glycosyltransferase involved in cell wall biosynthesis